MYTRKEGNKWEGNVYSLRCVAGELVTNARQGYRQDGYAGNGPARRCTRRPLAWAPHLIRVAVWEKRAKKLKEKDTCQSPVSTQQNAYDTYRWWWACSRLARPSFTIKEMKKSDGKHQRRVRWKRGNPMHGPLVSCVFGLCGTVKGVVWTTKEFSININLCCWSYSRRRNSLSIARRDPVILHCIQIVEWSWVEHVVMVSGWNTWYVQSKFFPNKKRDDRTHVIFFNLTIANYEMMPPDCQSERGRTKGKSRREI